MVIKFGRNVNDRCGNLTKKTELKSADSEHLVIIPGTFWSKWYYFNYITILHVTAKTRIIWQSMIFIGHFLVRYFFMLIIYFFIHHFILVRCKIHFSIKHITDIMLKKLQTWLLSVYFHFYILWLLRHFFNMLRVLTCL